ncbi:MAG: hypothetical protein RIQ71_837 [Verrucomicrobiota bacterium]|jgi:hypothetical protein
MGFFFGMAEQRQRVQIPAARFPHVWDHLSRLKCFAQSKAYHSLRSEKMSDPVTGSEIPYWLVWKDEDGISHQRRAFLPPNKLSTVSPGSATVWQCITGNVPTKVLFLTIPPGVEGDWHENPAPQWIIPLSGRWFVETMDGVRVEMGPGELSFGGDQGCRLIDGKRGHLSGSLDGKPVVLMLVQVEGQPKV